MVKFINAATGTEMWVAEDRAEEYKSAGHRPAPLPDEKPAPKKPAPKKTTKKK